MTRIKSLASLVTAAALGVALVGCGAGDAQQHLRSAVDAKGKSLRSCYEGALQRNASAKGSMQLWIHVEQQSGAVTKVEFQRSDIEDEEFKTCVKDTLEKITLPKTPKAGMKVDYTLRFQHEGAGGETPPAGEGDEGGEGEADGDGDGGESEGEAGASGGFELNLGGD